MIGNFLRKLFNSKTGIYKTERYLTPNELLNLINILHDTKDISSLNLRIFNNLIKSTIKAEFVNDDRVVSFHMDIKSKCLGVLGLYQDELIEYCTNNINVLNETIKNTHKLLKKQNINTVLPVEQEQQQVLDDIKSMASIVNVELEKLIQQIIIAIDYIDIPEIDEISNDIDKAIGNGKTESFIELLNLIPKQPC